MERYEVVILIVSSMCAGGVLVAAAGVMWIIRNRPRL